MTKPQAPQGATRRKPPPSAERLNKCAERGLTRLETAKVCRCSYSKVCRLAIDNGIEFRDEVRGSPPTMRGRVLNALFEQTGEVCYASIAKALGCTRQYVYTIARKIKERVK